MKKKKVLTIALACCAGALWSGCYTVLQNPHTVSSLHEDESSAADDYSAPVDRYTEDAEVDDGFYRYPGVPGSYGAYGGAGYPVSRYGCSYGSYYGYSNYGYGNYGYGGSLPYGAYADYGSYGYGPYSYGYDPYYTDRRGYYIPPGYELVNTRELDDIRASLPGAQGAAKPLDAEAIRAKQRQKEEVWTQRVSPQMRKAPAPPRSSASTISSPPASSSSPSSVSSSSSSSPPPASKTTSSKSDTKPTKRRR